jgi:hypothetical protein
MLCAKNRGIVPRFDLSFFALPAPPRVLSTPLTLDRKKSEKIRDGARFL